MKLRPLHDWLLVKEIDQSRMHASSVIFVDVHDMAHTNLICEVVAAGPGRMVNNKLIPCQAKTGSRVIFQRKRRTLYSPGEFMVRDSDCELAFIE